MRRKKLSLWFEREFIKPFGEPVTQVTALFTTILWLVVIGLVLSH